MREDEPDREMADDEGPAPVRPRGGQLGRGVSAGLLLEHLRRHGPASRIEITHAQGLSRSSVTDITADLIRDGIIMVCDEETAGDGKRGRPRVRLRLNPQAGYAVGVRVGLSRISVSVTDFLCDVVHAATTPFRISRDDPDATVEIVGDAVRAAIRDSGVAHDRISGVCVGVPGMVDLETGICHWSLALDSTPFPLGDRLSHRLGLPVLVETHTVPLAVAETEFGSARDCHTTAMLWLGHGIGAGLILGGSVHRGSHGFASEFSHTKVMGDGPECACGQTGCLEALIGIRALLDRAAPHLPDPIGDDPGTRELQLAEAAAMAEDGHAALQEVFAGIGPPLGRALANLCLIVDPSEVILSGPALAASRFWLGPLNTALTANLRAPMRDRVTIRTYPRDDAFWARGAAALVLQQFHELGVPGERRVRSAAPA